MKLLLDGNLDPSLQLKDLLSAISQAEAPGLSVLQFTTNQEENGEIYFLGGHYIVCARQNTMSLTGKAALDELLRLKESKFVYYACDTVDALPQPSDDLKIDLKELVDNWQEVKPASQGDLLDKIFKVTLPEKAPDLNKVLIEEPRQSHHRIEAMAISANQETGFRLESTEDNSMLASPILETSTPITAQDTHTTPRDDVDWDLVESLVSSGAPGSGTDSSDWIPRRNLPAPHDLRAIMRSSDWQYILRRIVLLIGLTFLFGVAIACGVWLFTSAPSAHMQPRHYIVPIEKQYAPEKHYLPEKHSAPEKHSFRRGRYEYQH